MKSYRRGVARIALQLVETVVLTLVLFVFVQSVVAQPFTVKQRSMEYTLEPDQYLLVDKLTPRFEPYHRSDIIVFNPSPAWTIGSDTPYVKRVIGVAGDVIELRDGRVILNDAVLEEPYVFELQRTDVLGDRSRWVVAAGELFVLGDHRSGSADSRLFGPIPVESVIGRVWLRYWPRSRFGVLAKPTTDP